MRIHPAKRFPNPDALIRECVTCLQLLKKHGPPDPATNQPRPQQAEEKEELLQQDTIHPVPLTNSDSEPIAASPSHHSNTITHTEDDSEGYRPNTSPALPAIPEELVASKDSTLFPGAPPPPMNRRTHFFKGG